VRKLHIEMKKNGALSTSTNYEKHRNLPLISTRVIITPLLKNYRQVMAE